MKALALVLALLEDPTELDCMAQTIYFEGRGDPAASQMLIGQAVLARQGRSDYPDTICGVVHQARKPGRFNCMFHWYCDGKPDTPTDARAWGTARLHAFATLLIGPQPGAPTHFHSVGTPDLWHFELVATVGGHHYSREPLPSGATLRRQHGSSKNEVHPGAVIRSRAGMAGTQQGAETGGGVLPLRGVLWESLLAGVGQD